ncbi:hypothetical protein, partial [Streptomyces sp. AB3(2024)]|uniref:hypothetical protein n=1 Tax=Streptomyces sp. AB3(2024) TaxID=3317321 RepID=UPI0035A3A9A3
MESLFRVEWTAVAPQEAPVGELRWAVLGRDEMGLGSTGLVQVTEYADVDALVVALEAGEPVPDAVFVAPSVGVSAEGVV